MDYQTRRFVKEAERDPRQQRLLRAFVGLSTRQLRVIEWVSGRIWSVDSTMSGKEQQHYSVTYGIEWETWDGNLRDSKEYPYWRCDCPDFEKHRHEMGFQCKHILAVKIMHAIPV